MNPFGPPAPHRLFCDAGGAAMAAVHEQEVRLIGVAARYWAREILALPIAPEVCRTARMLEIRRDAMRIHLRSGTERFLAELVCLALGRHHRS